VVANGTDCDDTNANAYPGQTAFFVTPRSNGHYDYNCNGTDGDTNGAEDQYQSMYDGLNGSGGAQGTSYVGNCRWTGSSCVTNSIESPNFGWSYSAATGQTTTALCGVNASYVREVACSGYYTSGTCWYAGSGTQTQGCH